MLEIQLQHDRQFALGNISCYKVLTSIVFIFFLDNKTLHVGG